MEWSKDMGFAEGILRFFSDSIGKVSTFLLLYEKFASLRSYWGSLGSWLTAASSLGVLTYPDLAREA
jgi:hypothetical protein